MSGYKLQYAVSYGPTTFSKVDVEYFDDIQTASEFAAIQNGAWQLLRFDFWLGCDASKTKVIEIGRKDK